MMTQKGWSQSLLKAGEQITVQGYRAKSEPFTMAARMIEVPGHPKMSAADSDGGPQI
jgi:hypothetical protein